MAQTLSSKKRVRQNETQRTRNRMLRSKLNTQLRKFRSARTAEVMEQQLSPSFRALDHAATKGIIHRNTASRKKRRLALALQKAKATGSE